MLLRTTFAIRLRYLLNHLFKFIDFFHAYTDNADFFYTYAGFFYT
jgi:hypothetical protein